MEFISRYFIPENVNFTINVNREDMSESKAVYDTMTQSLKKLSKDIANVSPKNKRVRRVHFKRKFLVADESFLFMRFDTAKGMMLYYTWIYDRNLHYSSYKHFINSHLLNGRFAVEHIWRITTAGEQVEI